MKICIKFYRSFLVMAMAKLILVILVFIIKNGANGEQP